LARDRSGKESKTEAIYVIPLRRVYWGRRRNRAARAVKYVRMFIARHFGVDPRDVIIYNDVNEYIWQRGIEKPPRYVRVRAVKVSEKEGEGYRVKVMLVSRTAEEKTAREKKAT